MKQIISEDFKSTKLTEMIKKIYDVTREEDQKYRLKYICELLYRILNNLEWRKYDSTTVSGEFIRWIIRNINFSGNVDVEKYLIDNNILSVESLDNFIESGKFVNSFLKSYYEEKNSGNINVEDLKDINEEIIKVYKERVVKSYDYGELESYEQHQNRNYQAQGKPTYKVIQKELSDLGLDQITDDHVHIITDMSLFKRKSRGQYLYCIALKDGFPKYICRFENTGAIADIREISGRYRGHNRSDQTIRWYEVENMCDSVMVFDDYLNLTDAARIKRYERSNNGYAVDGYIRTGYKSGIHMTDQERKDAVENERLDREKAIRDDRLLRLKLKQNTSKYDQKTVEFNDVLNDLRYKTSEMYELIKHEDLFDGEIEDLNRRNEKLALITMCVKEYKKYKVICDNYVNKNASTSSWESEYELRQIDEAINVIKSLINELDKKFNN